MLAIRCAERGRSLDIDLDDHVLPVGKALLDRRSRDAVEVVVDQGVFDELAVRDLSLEIGAFEEPIVNAVALAGPHRA